MKAVSELRANMVRDGQIDHDEGFDPLLKAAVSDGQSQSGCSGQLFAPTHASVSVISTKVPVGVRSLYSRRNQKIPIAI